MRLAVIISSFNPKTREFDGIWRECWHRVNPGVPIPGVHLHFGGTSWALHILDGTCSSYFNEAQCAWRFDRIEATIKEIAYQHASCQFQGLGLLHSDDPNDRDTFVKILPDPSCWIGHYYSGALGDVNGTYKAFILPFKEADCIETAFYRLWGHLVAGEECSLPTVDAVTNAKCHLQGLEHGCSRSITRIGYKLANAEQKPSTVTANEVLRYIVTQEAPQLEGRLMTAATVMADHASCYQAVNSIRQKLTQQIHQLETAMSTAPEPEGAFAACRAYLYWLSVLCRQLEDALEGIL